MASTFCGKTANDVWSEAAKQLKIIDGDFLSSRVGGIHELLHVMLSIDNPIEKWVSQRSPTMSISFALAELVWILNGSNESRIINYWNTGLQKYSGFEENYHGAYGFRIRQNFGVDQLERVYSALKNNPESRQAVILIWDPIQDLPNESGAPRSSDIPCNICSLIKIRDNRLEWAQIMRSNDVFRGLPYNIVQFTSIQEILAGWLGINPGSYTHFSDSLHIYENDKKTMDITDNKFSRNGDSLSLPKQLFDKIIKDIYERMCFIVANNPDENKLRSLSQLQTAIPAYNNIMFIIAAYAAKKLKYIELKSELVADCTNELYRQIWKKWDEQKERSLV
jgi:thymidylate synthase